MYFIKPNMFRLSKLLWNKKIPFAILQLLASRRTWSGLHMGPVAEIAGRWNGMAHLGKKPGEQTIGISLFLMPAQMWSWTWVWCLLQVNKEKEQNCFPPTLSCRSYLHGSLGELCPCLGSQARALVCETAVGTRGKKELNCLATVQVTDGVFLVGEKLLSSSSVFPF